VENLLAKAFGEREVEATVEFRFDKGQIISFFQPINVGEHSQILDEIIGFTGIKKDHDGKILYTMEIAITDTSLEQKLSFRQTVRLEDNMPVALLETASKLSALAIKPKEGK
jgi:ABC-type lipopolysaccharide export system ATPase subunit